MSTPLITPELVSLDANLGSTKTEVITSVAGLIAAAGRADADGLAHDALDRESKSPTGMPGGFAIPTAAQPRYLRYPWGSPGYRPLSTSMDLTARPTSSL
ncbi:PTS system [Cutibacterium acnes JCM 18916]|nr:PTS system [Cutibacterium acnes JCM 18916]